VYDNVRVFGHAHVYGNAKMYGNVKMCNYDWENQGDEIY